MQSVLDQKSSIYDLWLDIITAVMPNIARSLEKGFLSKVGVAMEQISHVARHLIFTAGVNLMSTFQWNCNSRVRYSVREL